MKALITGATGFIGYHIVQVLLKRGICVRALVRDNSDASFLSALGVEVVRGDVREPASIDRAIHGCTYVYHVAADYRLWVPDALTMYDINVQGTKNVMQAALDSSVEKVIYTSTVGVLASSSSKSPSNEDSIADLRNMVGNYKRTKFLAEKWVYSFIEKGLPVVIVSPSTPIGACDKKPTPTGRIIVDFLNGRIPAYLDTGLNFVDVEDVAAGHVLAAEHGRIGQKYILGNRNMTLRDFFVMLADATGKKHPKVRLPYFPVLIAAYADEAWANLVSHKQPRIPLIGVKLAKRYMYFDSSKAVGELHMPQSSIDCALTKAVHWFTENGYVPQLGVTASSRYELGRVPTGPSDTTQHKGNHRA